MNYKELSLQILRESKIKDLDELFDDYNNLIEMRNNGVHNRNKIKEIYYKYEDEIRVVDNYRVVVSNILHKQNIYHNIDEGSDYTLETLIDHLISIMYLRFAKDIVDENIKARLSSSNDKEAYDIISYIRDNVKV